MLAVFPHDPSPLVTHSITRQEPWLTHLVEEEGRGRRPFPALSAPQRGVRDLAMETGVNAPEPGSAVLKDVCWWSRMAQVPP